MTKSFRCHYRYSSDQNCRVLNLINNEKKKMKAILNNKTTTVNKSEKKQLPRWYVAINVVDSHGVSMRTRTQLFILVGSVSISGSKEPNQCGTMRIRILVRIWSHKKLNFLHFRYCILKIRFRSKTYLRRNKSPLQRQKIRFICKFFPFSCFWIRICIPNTDPDPGQPNACGYGSTTIVAS